MGARRMMEAEEAATASSQMPTRDDIPIDQNGNVIMDRVLDEEGAPVKNYPLAEDPRDRRAQFENCIMRAYLEKRALERGEEPPERVYQSDFDRKWHAWCDRNWDRYQRVRTWAENGRAPRA